MFGLGAATRIYVAVGPTDMRKSFEGLFGLVKERLGCSPLSGQPELGAVYDFKYSFSTNLSQWDRRPVYELRALTQFWCSIMDP